MKFWIWIIIIVGVLIVAAICRCVYELHTLQIAKYAVNTGVNDYTSKKVVFISDLHGRTYGPENERLVELIKNEKPEAILVGGDMTVARYPKRDEIAFDLMRQLVKIAPVYYAPGNHECGVRTLKMYKQRWQNYLDELEKIGVKYLSNQCVKLDSNNGKNAAIIKSNGDAATGVDDGVVGFESKTNICIWGLDLDYKFYSKTKPIHPGLADIEAAIGKLDENSYNILLAHNPWNFKDYAAVGADLVLAGHYHGGAVKIFGQGLISPQFIPFPRYSYGRFETGKTTMIVTSGCGSHSVNLRLFNKPEVVAIEIGSEK